MLCLLLYSFAYWNSSHNLPTINIHQLAKRDALGSFILPQPYSMPSQNRVTPVKPIEETVIYCRYINICWRSHVNYNEKKNTIHCSIQNRLITTYSKRFFASYKDAFMSEVAVQGNDKFACTNGISFSSSRWSIYLPCKKVFPSYIIIALRPR